MTVRPRSGGFVSKRNIDPRFIRLRNAPDWFGMDRNRFNSEIRPLLTVIPIGVQGIAFDRQEMEIVAEDYKAKNGTQPTRLGEGRWREKHRQGSSKGLVSGISINGSAGKGFAKALEQLT
jgi:hypothetical protein